VRTADAAGWTLLHVAAASEGGSVDRRALLELLMDPPHGLSPVTTLDNQKKTALHVAAWQGHPRVAQLLIARGASVLAADVNGHTPMDDATTGAVERLAASPDAVPGLSSSELEWYSAAFAVADGAKAGVLAGVAQVVAGLRAACLLPIEVTTIDADDFVDAAATADDVRAMLVERVPRWAELGERLDYAGFLVAVAAAAAGPHRALHRAAVLCEAMARSVGHAERGKILARARATRERVRAVYADVAPAKLRPGPRGEPAPVVSELRAYRWQEAVLLELVQGRYGTQ